MRVNVQVAYSAVSPTHARAHQTVSPLVRKTSLRPSSSSSNASSTTTTGSGLTRRRTLMGDGMTVRAAVLCPDALVDALDDISGECFLSPVLLPLSPLRPLVVLVPVVMPGKEAEKTTSAVCFPADDVYSILDRALIHLRRARRELDQAEQDISTVVLLAYATDPNLPGNVKAAVNEELGTRHGLITPPFTPATVIDSFAARLNVSPESISSSHHHHDHLHPPRSNSTSSLSSSPLSSDLFPQTRSMSLTTTLPVKSLSIGIPPQSQHHHNLIPNSSTSVRHTLPPSALAHSRSTTALYQLHLSTKPLPPLPPQDLLPDSERDPSSTINNDDAPAISPSIQKGNNLALHDASTRQTKPPSEDGVASSPTHVTTTISEDKPLQPQLISSTIERELPPSKVLPEPPLTPTPTPSAITTSSVKSSLPQPPPASPHARPLSPPPPSTSNPPPRKQSPFSSPTPLFAGPAIQRSTSYVDPISEYLIAGRRRSVDNGGLALALSGAKYQFGYDGDNGFGSSMDVGYVWDMEMIGGAPEGVPTDTPLYAELLSDMLYHTNSVTNVQVPDDADAESMCQISSEERIRLVNAISTWNFEPHLLSCDDLIKCAILLFEAVFRIEGMLSDVGMSSDWQATMCKFLHALRSIYREQNKYHNFRHAIDVFQASYSFLEKGECVPPVEILLDAGESVWKRSGKTESGMEMRDVLENRDIFALCIAAVGHDVGHPGLSNAFMKNAHAPLSTVYDDKSALEQMHCALLIQLMKKTGLGHLVQTSTQPATSDSGLQQEDAVEFRKLLTEIVLITDMSLHFEWIGRFTKVGEERQSGQCTSCGSDEKSKLKLMICQALIKCGDISNPTRPHAVSEHWSTALLEEWSSQAQLERELGLNPSVVDSNDGIVQAKGQIGFIDLFTKPLFGSLAAVVPELDFFSQQCDINRALWKTRLDDLTAIKLEKEKAAEASGSTSEGGNTSADDGIITRDDIAPSEIQYAAVFPLSLPFGCFGTDLSGSPIQGLGATLSMGNVDTANRDWDDRIDAEEEEEGLGENEDAITPTRNIKGAISPSVSPRTSRVIPSQGWPVPRSAGSSSSSTIDGSISGASTSVLTMPSPMSSVSDSISPTSTSNAPGGLTHRQVLAMRRKKSFRSSWDGYAFPPVSTAAMKGVAEESIDPTSQR
ncbi:3',5'-cyclic-nucleotide phosphodiesterase [Tulasnella sp. 419]|nr:3',5'-cyclic-nucleotide phosphodiesterase [Tulasnella sp. 419]